jgi:cytochrome b involved in lipid metabolism
MRIVVAIALIFALSGCAAPEAADAPVELQTQESSAPDSSSAEQGETEEPEQVATADPETEQSPEPTVETSPESTAQPQQTAEASPSPTATATATPSPTATVTATPTPTPTETAVAGFTMAEVRQNNTASSCWVAVNGRVFDLTPWIPKHPGREGPILALCGTDGTTSFNSRHGGQSSPTATLESYDIGPLR